MKIVPGLVASLSALALALSASASPTISVEAGPLYGGLNPWQSQGGGEFTAFSSAGIPQGYASDATLSLSGMTGFETFCILPGVDLGWMTPYSYSIDPDIWVPTSGDLAAGANDEALSQGTAWLYAQFATGQLSGYDYADSDKSNSRLNDASALQQALWYFQGETYLPSDPTFVNLALARFGSTSAAMAAENPGEFGTDVINIYTTNADGRPDVLQQAQLVYAPDLASTALLLGGGLLILLAARKRLALAVDTTG
ncbi:MAG TPA: hypothetical protein VGL42_00145 [Opitutaceae bacterium]|jgi:hypothetical protein